MKHNFWFSLASGSMNFGWHVMKFAILKSERSVLSAETLLVCVYAFALGKQEILNFVFKSFHGICLPPL